jgi:hypothetical protein
VGKFQPKLPWGAKLSGREEDIVCSDPRFWFTYKETMELDSLGKKEEEDGGDEDDDRNREVELQVPRFQVDRTRKFWMEDYRKSITSITKDGKEVQFLYIPENQLPKPKESLFEFSEGKKRKKKEKKKDLPRFYSLVFYFDAPPPSGNIMVRGSFKLHPSVKIPGPERTPRSNEFVILTHTLKESALRLEKRKEGNDSSMASKSVLVSKKTNEYNFDPTELHDLFFSFS